MNGPGRPSIASSPDARDAILRSACLHFARYGIAGSSKRQVAIDANVTPAMVHYYFKRKEDLYLAVLHSAFDPLLAALRDIDTLEGWTRAFHEHLSKRLWMPHLMIREVLSQDGLLRSLFLKHFAPQMFGAIKAAVTKEAKLVKARRGLDIDRHVVLLMGMLVYPFLGLEIGQDVTGRKFDKKMLEGFRDDALNLFRRGIAA